MLENLNWFFGWAAAAAILLSLIATVGKLWTGAIIDGQKAKEIADLKSTVRVLQPRSNWDFRGRRPDRSALKVRTDDCGLCGKNI
jgi:hypothetical protein